MRCHWTRRQRAAYERRRERLDTERRRESAHKADVNELHEHVLHKELETLARATNEDCVPLDDSPMGCLLTKPDLRPDDIPRLRRIDEKPQDVIFAALRKRRAQNGQLAMSAYREDVPFVLPVMWYNNM